MARVIRAADALQPSRLRPAAILLAASCTAAPSDDVPRTDTVRVVDAVVRVDTVHVIDTVVALGDVVPPESVRPGPPVAAPPSTEPGSAAPTVTEADLAYLRSRDLLIPVPGVTPERLPNTFNEMRGTRRHNALDILAPRGTPVLAADDGRVLQLHKSTAGGITVYASDPASRAIYFYAHLEGYRPGLADGQAVHRGDTLGYVGTTGNAPPNTPHLHFAIAVTHDISKWWSGTPVDPRPLLGGPSVQLPLSLGDSALAAPAAAAATAAAAARQPTGSRPVAAPHKATVSTAARPSNKREGTKAPTTRRRARHRST